jgi:hypothetical protein
MSQKSNAAGRSNRWATRRVLGSVLGVAVVVGSAATAKASGHGDGFFTPHHGNPANARTMATAAISGHGKQDADSGDRPTGHKDSTSADHDGRKNADHGSTQCSDHDMKAAAEHGTVKHGTTKPAKHENVKRAKHENVKRAEHENVKRAKHDEGDLPGWTWAGDGSSRYEFRTLGDKADKTFNQLLGINDCGNIVGYYGSGTDRDHPNKGYSVNAPYNKHSFLDENYPHSAQTQVVGVNNRGTTVGFYVDHDGGNYGFVHRGGTWERVSFPRTTSNPSFNQLLGINDHGIAAGFWNDDKGDSHGYLYNTANEHFTTIDLPLHADSVTVTGVNDHGKAVGFYKEGKHTRGFISTEHSFKSLQLGDDSNTQVLGVNEDGDVVGSYVGGHGTTHGFVRMDDKVRVIDAPGSTSTVVNGLNDKGQIVGFYQDYDKNTKGFTAHQ